MISVLRSLDRPACAAALAAVLGLSSCHHDFSFLTGETSSDSPQGAGHDAASESGSDSSDDGKRDSAKDGSDRETDLADAGGTVSHFHFLAVGEQHVCAIHGPDKVIYCLGGNDLGQLGNGETSPRDELPTSRWSEVKDPGLSFGPPYALVAGTSHTCAARGDNVFCWGGSQTWVSGSELSIVTEPNRIVYNDFIAGPVLELASGDQHVCARTETDLRCWGDNKHAQISGNLSAETVFLAEVPDFGKVKRLAFGRDFSLAIAEKGGVLCWGLDAFGQCGEGPPNGCPFDLVEGCVLTPTPIPSLPAATAIGAGGAHGCAVAEKTGQVRCWGYNSMGQVGLPPDECTDWSQCNLPPTLVPDQVTGADMLALGDEHTCALTKGEVWCWGEGGSLGRNLAGKTTVPTPGRVVDEGNNPLKDIVEIVASSARTCARDAIGDIFCWDRDNGYAVKYPWLENVHDDF